jgi:sulfur-oxidizing protein SoxY
MAITELLKAKPAVGRRAFLRALTALMACVAFGKEMLAGDKVWAAQAGSSGLPLPDERLEATLQRLFGNRSFASGEGKIKLELPLIAEDGANVAVTVDLSLPVSGATRLSHVYIIADKNRRPMLAKFSFTPESGRAFIATSLRLATTTDVRAVAEMNDGTLYAVGKNVRVTISGCDLPPQS